MNDARAAAASPRSDLHLPAGLGRRIGSWRYAEEGRRDRRLDLLRGYCVFAMTVDHLDAPTWLFVLTGGNRFFVSAAEGFVFISGLLMGMIYRPILARRGFRAAALKALRRAGFLYLITVGASLGFMWLSSRLGLPWAAGLDLREVLFAAVTLTRSFYLTDVLLLYTVLIALTPLALWLLKRGSTSALAAASWGIWVVHQLRPIDLPWPSEESAFYYTAAWQALFFTALMLGWHRDWLAQRFGWMLGWPGVLTSGLGVVLLLALYAWGAIWADRFVAEGGALLSDAFAKWNLPPARIVAIATVFAFAFLLVHHLWVPICRTLGRVLLPFGESALAAYVIHLAVVAGLTAYREYVPRGEITTAMRGTAFQLFAVAILWLSVSAWTSFRRALDRGLIPETVARRLDPALGALFGLVLVVGIFVAPLPAEPVSAFVPVREDRASIEQPYYALYVPPGAAELQPLTAMVVLHPNDEEAEAFGEDLTRLADRDGWVLVAPQLPYSDDQLDPEAIAAESPALLRGIREVIGGLPSATSLRLRRRVILFGYGRGAPAAERYALAYPDDVRAVALLGGSGYTLPPAPDGDDPPFPFGVDGLGERLGVELNAARVSRVRYWIGVGAQDNDPADVSRAWDPYLGATRVERSRNLAAALSRTGAQVEMEIFPGTGHELTPEMRLAVAEFAERARPSPPPPAT